jgi:DNA-binding winged helix-turn-helix (wHTH) protein/Tfp pilus assembly protein PilF
MSVRKATVFDFHQFRLDADKRLLFQDGQPVVLAPKGFDILLYLVQHRDRVVTKAELLTAVWPDTFVEEANLAQNVSVIRRALGESPRDHKSIITIPGRGYRFVADVREVLPALGEQSQAYQLFLKGRHFLNKRLTGTLRDAITLFVQSTDEDPTYAPAWVGLADAYALLSLYGASMPRDVFPKSRAAAETALQLDPALAEAHNSLGVVALFYDWNWAEAERAFRRAIELKPEYGDAHQRYGIYLTAMGRFDEAQAALDRAQTLDPLSRITATIGAYPSYYGRRFDAAVRQYRHVLQLDPGFSMAHFRLGLALAQQGSYPAAIEELMVAQGLSNDRDVVAALGFVHALMGDRARAGHAIAELDERSRDTFVSPYLIASIHAALGDHDRALALLEQAVVDRSYWVIYLDVDPALDALRGDPRFDALRRRVFPAGSSR